MSVYRVFCKTTLLVLIVLTVVHINCSVVYAKDNVVVVIDAGHGGSGKTDETELGAKYSDNILEKKVNLITAYALKEELEEYNNVICYLTRTDDTAMSLEDRVAMAANLDADVIVSCHYNASADKLFYGGEIFTSAYGNCYMTGYGLAECIRDEWIEAGIIFRDIKTKLGNSGGDYYGIIRRGTEIGLPVIILEHASLDNHLDYERFGTEEDWKRLGRCDAKGIAEYFGLSKDYVLNDVEPTVNVAPPNNRKNPDTTAPEGVTLEIIDCNIETNEITYEISAKDEDGKLMYYGLALGEPDEITDGEFADLILWEQGKKTMTGTFSVPTAYSGSIVARVYNTYELYSDSNVCEIDMATLLEEYEESLVSEDEVIAEGPVVIYPKGSKPADNPFDVEEDASFDLGGRKVKVQTEIDKERDKALFGLIVACVIGILVIVIIMIIVVRNIILPKLRENQDEWDYKL